MFDPSLKTTIMEALRDEPEFSRLPLLKKLNNAEAYKFLLWLDRSGLALYFFDRLRQHAALTHLPDSLSVALRDRLERNKQRTEDMLKEFQRLNDVFRKHKVRIAALKGFTLVPEFCSSPFLRHQTDFDFLVDSQHVELAADALQSGGYATSELVFSGESCFTTPLQHIPTTHDDIFAKQKQRQVDLHTSIWEDTPFVSLKPPEACLDKWQARNLLGADYFSLASEDMFLLQLLHAFKHMLHSWLRVSWLLEIDYFLKFHHDDANLWHRFGKRINHCRTMRQACAVVVALTNRLFPRRLPAELQSLCEESLSKPMRIWLEQFGSRWALTDWPGSLLNLFLCLEFIPQDFRRTQYLKSRLLPVKRQFSIGNPRPENTRHWICAKSSQLAYVANRAIDHLTGLLSLPPELWRWQHALYLSKKSIR